MGKKCAIVALALLVFAADVHCQSQSCGLKVTPAKAVRVRPGHDVTLVCDASCFGPLSRDQLQWRDPRGGRIPAQAAGVRLFAVTYNRWKLSRVVLLNPQLGDSGVYTCELRHGGQHLQYAAVVQVEDDEEVDVGPRRGDIYIEPDPDFTNTRPVRSVPSDVQGDAENDDSFPDYPGEVSDPRDSPDEPGDDADLHADSDYDTELHDNANSEPGAKDNLKDIDPEVMFTPNGRNRAGMKQLSITKELSANARLDDVKTQVRIRRNVGDEGRSSNNDTLPEFYADNETTTQVSGMFDNNATDENSTSQLNSMGYDSNVNATFQIGDMLPVTPVLTTMNMNDNVTSTVKGEMNSTLTSTFPGASSTTASTPDVANFNKSTGTPPHETHTPTAAATTTTPAATTTVQTVKTAAPDKSTKRSTTKHPTGTGGYNPAKSNTNAGTDPDFGRYGVLAFALALSAAFLLLVALLLVLLCPRFFSGKRQKHIINTPGEEGGGRHGGARPRSRGDGDGVFLMGEMPHKKPAPMTSATGLNGEYHTAIDLDSDDPNKVKAKEGQVQEEAKKNAAEGEKKEEEAKPQESFVSTFLIGRLSSSKQTEGEKLGDASAVEGDEDVFKSAPAGADKPVTESEAKEEKEEKEAKEEKEEKEKEKEGSSSSGSSSSSSDSDAEETGKKDSSDDGNDARPASIGSGAGMMPNIRIEFKETNMDEV